MRLVRIDSCQDAGCSALLSPSATIAPLDHPFNGVTPVRVLITGGAGFIGSHLCDKFLAEGHTVIAMDNLITGSTRNIEHLAGHERFRFIKHNVTNYIYIEGPIDAVLHFASPASPIDYLNYPIQ